MKHQTLEQFNAQIGRRIRAARGAHGLSATRLAELSGIAEARLRRYENGSASIRIVELERISVSLALPISHFLSGCVMCGSA